MKKNNQINLNKCLEELEEISEWFNNQEELDIEEGLKKFKKGSELIKESRTRLRDIENEFEEIKKESDSFLKNKK